MTELPDIEVARYALRTFNTAGNTLQSIVIPGDHWAGGVCIAKCHREDFLGDRADIDHPGPHTSPPESLKTRCQCGIYGCLTVDALRWQYPRQSRKLIAVIAAEGPTIIGDTGLRTSAARVVAFWAPDRELRRICLNSCPDARVFDALDVMLADYGFPPATLFPPALPSAKPDPLTRLLGLTRVLQSVVTKLMTS